MAPWGEIVPGDDSKHKRRCKTIAAGRLRLFALAVDCIDKAQLEFLCIGKAFQRSRSPEVSTKWRDRMAFWEGYNVKSTITERLVKSPDDLMTSGVVHDRP